MAAQIADPQPLALLKLMSDGEKATVGDLPDTGVGLATETLLSSVFIASAHYGTRASTALIVEADGRQRMVERSFGVNGVPLGEIALDIGG